MRSHSQQVQPSRHVFCTWQWCCSVVRTGKSRIPREMEENGAGVGWPSPLSSLAGVCAEYPTYVLSSQHVDHSGQDVSLKWILSLLWPPWLLVGPFARKSLNHLFLGRWTLPTGSHKVVRNNWTVCLQPRGERRPSCSDSWQPNGCNRYCRLLSHQSGLPFLPLT